MIVFDLYILEKLIIQKYINNKIEMFRYEYTSNLEFATVDILCQKSYLNVYALRTIFLGEQHFKGFAIFSERQISAFRQDLFERRIRRRYRHIYIVDCIL